MDKDKHMTIEHHCLQMRYAHLRVHNPKTIETLATSIKQYGQLAPVAVVPETTQKWVLIDGYHRVKALKRLGKDTIEAEVWDCNAQEALLTMLKNRSARRTGIFEEALVLHELYSQHSLSQQDLATRVGRDQSWISRRLSLVEYLPDSILEALNTSSVSLWVCARVLVPMARAIPDHAQHLLTYLLKCPHSTREMRFFYEHYQKSNHQARARMVEHPALFFKAQSLLYTERQTAALKNGPEGKWRDKCHTLTTVLAELSLLAPSVFFRQTPEGCVEPSEHLIEQQTSLMN